MPHFVVVGHDAPTTPDFSLADLPGTAGRLDLLARSVIDALLLSHDIRRDTTVSLVLADEYTLMFDGNEVRNLHPDERSTAARIQTALKHRDEAIGDEPAPIAPGIELYRRGFERTLRATADTGPIVHLTPEGDPIAETRPPDTPAFVLSDHRPFTDADVALLDDLADRQLSVGPHSLHANQVITVAHNWLDTGGFMTH